jgi:hypothetical protein
VPSPPAGASDAVASGRFVLLLLVLDVEIEFFALLG